MGFKRAEYLCSFAEKKLSIFRRLMKKAADSGQELSATIMGKEIKTMAKKDKKEKKPDFMIGYRENIRKLQILSRLATQKFLGSRPAGDPRQDYLLGIEAFKNLSNVYLEVIMELMISTLGIPKEKFLELMEKKLGEQVKSIEQDLCVTSWDAAGNPIFDLKKYAEKTKTWPV